MIDTAPHPSSLPTGEKGWGEGGGFGHLKFESGIYLGFEIFHLGTGLSRLKRLPNGTDEQRDLFIEDRSHIEDQFVLADSGNNGRFP